MKRKPPTSWEPVQKWYQRSVGKEGHYYHQEVVLPGILRLLKDNGPQTPAVVDLACGQGVLARAIPEGCRYLGIDLSPQLVAHAKRQDRASNHRYRVGDITDPKLKSEDDLFDVCTIVLALQNVADGAAALRNAGRFLSPGGKLILVLNHPCFRIPRQSFWGVDEAKRCRYRRMESYLSAQQIPIQAHPSKGEESAQTWSFHHPLTSYFTWLREAGFAVTHMEEWTSPKLSTGKNAKMENRSRQEFPLFLALVAAKIS